MMYLYQLSDANGNRHMIISDWEPERIARLQENLKTGFEVETHTDLAGYFGCPVEIVR